MTKILASNERRLAHKLLELTTIYSQFKKLEGPWIEFLNASISIVLPDENKNKVEFTPRELMRLTTSICSAMAPDLRESIRALKYNKNGYEQDLYDRLVTLQVQEITHIDKKGVFLLATIAAERNKVFHEQS